MNSKVRVVANATTGAVVNVSENNPDYGYVRLEQDRTVIDENNFVKTKTTSTLVQGEVVELQKMNFYAGQELPGKICIKESLEPFNSKNPERDLKVAGETGIVCSVEGSPIYRKTIWDMSDSKTDVFVQHDNVDELRAAYESQRANTASALTPNDDFSIGG